MFSLKRKKKEEDDDEEEGEEKAKEKKTRRGPKKKEEKKPWGRGERYLVFGVLIGTVIVSLVLALYARSWKWPGLPRIKLPENAFEETFVLEGNPAPEKLSKTVKESFDLVTKEASGVYGLYVIDLYTDTSFGESEDEEFQAASLIKLPLMSAVYEASEKRRLDLDETYTLQETDKIAGAGSLYYQPAGTQVTYRELIELMGKQSDNTAFNIMLNTYGRKKLQDYIDEIGMRGTSYETNTTTPRDIGLYFRKLWEGKLVSAEDRDELLGDLTDTAFEEWLAAGIPDDVQIAHKFGLETHVVNDAGIVLAPKPYVLVVLSKGAVESEAKEIIPQIASSVHEQLGR